MTQYIDQFELSHIFGISYRNICAWKNKGLFGDLDFISLPNTNKLYVDREKFTDYILSRIKNKDNMLIKDQDKFNTIGVMVGATELSKKLKINKMTFANWNRWNDETPWRAPVVGLPGSPKYRISDIEMWIDKYTLGRENPNFNFLDDELMTEKDLLTILGISQQSLQRRRRLGSPPIPYIRMGHTIIRYMKSDVTKFLRNKKLHKA